MKKLVIGKKYILNSGWSSLKGINGSKVTLMSVDGKFCTSSTSNITLFAYTRDLKPIVKTIKEL